MSHDVSDILQARGWNERSVIRWGDSQLILVPAGALPVGGLITRPLVYVQAPSPCIWRVCAVIEGFDAADAVTFRFLLDIGNGSMTARTRSDSAGTPGGIASAEVAAQVITARLEIGGGPIVVQRSVTASIWAAPVVPFDGLCVGVNCDGQ